ncbi:3'-5' exonuclease [Citricoccus sp. NPDC079358]|uniref:HelD family protein n=1 Tax=Citricoccus sp. NPDC079358 TaxID=3154653 RepID=UPI00344D796A
MTGITDQDKALERSRLAEVIEALTLARERLTASIERSAASIQDSKELIWAHQRDMDHAEKANVRVEVDVSVGLATQSVEALRQVERSIRSPYFGRVDFRRETESSAGEHYIGLHSFRDPDTQRLLIHDWRAPVSSLYYDFESGEAYFQAPEGLAEGEITGKRQYRIEDGQLQYLLESTLNIGDDVLQEELSRSADDKMKNIVATIQREQNAVIRNEDAPVLILQGVAGSGKTSIALHRVAFLLYRFKDTLSSDDVMILSPNQVFGDYISNVLPELGEEQVAEIDFDAIARRFLAKVAEYQSFSEQVTTLLEAPDEAVTARIRYKAGPEFITRLDEWITERSRERFTPAPIRQAGHQLEAEWVADRFAALDSVPVFTRLERLAEAAVHRLKPEVNRRDKWRGSDTTSVRKQVRAMFADKDALTMYKAFYDHPERREMFAPLGRKKIEYADVFPLVHTMLRTRRHESPYGRIRHLLVDEMQDYTAVQYAVLRELFSCKMTILGDANQSVNPFSSSSLETIHGIFPQAHCLELTKSYRSTTEITEFAQHIRRNDKLVPIDRPGTPPQVLACQDAQDETDRIAGVVRDFQDSGHRSMGIICKTVAQAHTLHQALDQAGIEATFLDYGSAVFAAGVVITSAHIAKGLEFDTVIVPGVDAGNYATEVDKSMLYVACTRAMHELTLTHQGTPSGFLTFAAIPAH